VPEATGGAGVLGRAWLAFWRDPDPLPWRFWRSPRG